MLDKFYAHPNLPPEVVALRERAYANVHLNAAARAYAAGAIADGQRWLATALGLDPALRAGEPPQAVASLTSFALTPLAGGAHRFLKTVLTNPPPGNALPRWSARKARGLLHAVAAFERHRQRATVTAAAHALVALACDPAWRRNRGLWSIAGGGLGRRAKSHTATPR